jgi:hypothetical protein
MPQRPKRETVDLSAYPDLVVIYLGMRVNTGAILNRWKHGRDPSRTGCGGSNSCATAAAPDSGMRRTSVGAVSRPCTWTCNRQPGWRGLRPSGPRVVRCSRRAGGLASGVNQADGKG